MITREKFLDVEDFDVTNVKNANIQNEAIFFDLEHYVYKKPICIGVFGCCIYDESIKKLKVTQFMIENKEDSKVILKMAENYFKEMIDRNNKKYIITFSGNNDFTVINYLFKKHKINFDFSEHFIAIDLQREYEKEKKVNIGLKALEKEFGIIRESELISGSNLAKTFSKVVKDDCYIKRMPEEKKNKILLYNEQDVVSLFYIFTNWNRILK